MVFAVILLLTVSSLAAHVNAIPTKGLPDKPVVQHACEGKALCDIRPENYHQEEIDRFVAQNLHHLHRMKRQADFQPIEVTPNNCIKNVEPRKFFTIDSNGGAPERILQTGLFDQTVPVVICESQDGPCFEDITNDSGRRFACKTVNNDVYFVVRTKDGRVEQRTSSIPTDCMCSEKLD